MAELLFWNTLSESANWLGETLGEQVTPKSLIQKILDRAESAGRPFPPTIIKALLPRDVRLASVWLLDKKGDIGEVDRRINERLTEVFGEPPIKGSLYTGDISAKAIPLYPAQIADLIVHGNLEVSLIHENQLGGYKLRDGEYGYILPIGTPHIATIETCGINRDDLLALANQLSASGITQAGDAQAAPEPVQAQNKAKAAPVPVALTEQLVDDEIASWFDGVSYQQLAGLFKEHVDPTQNEEVWRSYAYEARTNGLKAAKVSRGKFNPYIAGHWWLDRKNPTGGWTPARVNRTLANNLPARSLEHKPRLTGDNYK